MKWLQIFSSVYIILSSCTQRDNNEPKYSSRDSLLKENLLEIGSLPYYDTTEINYKMLKAYQNNDTDLLKRINEQIRKEKEYEKYFSTIYNCIPQPNLQDLNADQAYRFILFPAFCSTPLNITVTKRKDTANLHFLLYKIGQDTAKCRIISEYDKELTSKEWDEFINQLSFADIWGLKRENGIHGHDGTTIYFMGYQKGNRSFGRPDKVFYVYRWGHSTLNQALDLVLKISGNKKGCYWIQ